MKSFFNYAKNRILYNIFRFLFFLIVALILLSSKVNALDTNFSNLLVQGYNNNGNSLTIPSVFNCNEVGSCGMEITTLANSYGGFWSIQSPIPMLNNHIYAVTLQVRSSNVPVTLSSKYNLSIGNTLDDAKTNYANSKFYNDLLFYKDSGNSTLQYIFRAKTSATYIGIPFTTTSNTTANFMIDSIIIEDLGDKSLTESEINNITNNQTSILQNDINNLSESIDNTLKNNFNDCYTNLFNLNGLTLQHANITYLNNGFIVDSDRYWSYAYYSINLPKGKYTLSGEISGNVNFVELYIDNEWLVGAKLNNGAYTFELTSDSLVTLRFYATTGDVITSSSTFYRIQLENGSSAHSYIDYGTEVCKNKIDSTNDKLDEANKTSKGIWDTLKNLPKTILDGFLDLLLKVFVPEDDFFSNWFNEVKSMFEEQLGFLATPFTIIIEFVERFLGLNSSTDIIINIPDITVPNFENITLIKSTSFNWSSLLNSKDSLKNLWTLYLDFIDVFLILNFIGLCSSIYGRIFGGDTSNFEYYTVEDTYTVNDSTGEVTNHRLNQRKTTRKKVN